MLREGDGHFEQLQSEKTYFCCKLYALLSTRRDWERLELEPPALAKIFDRMYHASSA